MELGHIGWSVGLKVHFDISLLFRDSDLVGNKLNAIFGSIKVSISNNVVLLSREGDLVSEIFCVGVGQLFACFQIDFVRSCGLDDVRYLRVLLLDRNRRACWE